MKASILGLCLLIVSLQWSFALQQEVKPPAVGTNVEQEILKLPGS